MCVGVGMGGRLSHRGGGGSGGLPGKILIFGALKSEFQCTLIDQGKHSWHFYLPTFALFYIMFPLYILHVYVLY